MLKTIEEFWAKQRGVDVETYRAQEAFRKRISAEAEKYEGKPPEEWPPITFNWDLSRASQKFSLDPTSHKNFDQNYPDGFCLGWVDLAEFDKRLCHYSRRDGDELWKLGFSSVLAYLIVYLSEGHPISPPLARPIENDEIRLHGGHHRYAIAKVIEEKKIPIHVEPEFQEAMDQIVKVRWQS